MMTFPTEWKVIKVMFQTTNQIWFGTYNVNTYRVFWDLRMDARRATTLVIPIN